MLGACGRTKPPSGRQTIFRLLDVDPFSFYFSFLFQSSARAFKTIVIMTMDARYGVRYSSARSDGRGSLFRRFEEEERKEAEAQRQQD